VLQGLAGVLALGTLACWLLTIRLACKTRYEQIIASALATFWPTLAIEGCKVGNDALLYLVAAATTWQLVVWRRTGSSSSFSLIAAAALAGAAPSVKGNGLVVVGLFLSSLGLFVLRNTRRGLGRWPRGSAKALGALTAMLLVWLYVLGGYKSWTTHPDFASIGANHHIDNTLADFFLLRLDSFAATPWVQSGASPGRDAFWNYLLRSSLFGEYGTDDPIIKSSAYGLVTLTLALSLLAFAGLVACLRDMVRGALGQVELIACFCGFIVFLVCLRLLYPYAPHNDFRFALPIVLPFAVFISRSANVLWRKRHRFPHIATLAGWMVVAFCLLALDISVLWS
jgi:hypothetical protein